MKEIFKAFGLVIIPSAITIVLIVINGFAMNVIENGWIVSLIFGMTLFMIVVWGFVLYKANINVDKFPLVNENFALFFYALFISSLVTGISFFIRYNNFREFTIAMISIALALVFLFIAYKKYFENKQEHEIAHDFLLSISASLLVGTASACLDADIKWNSNTFLLIGITVFFLIVSISIVWYESNHRKE